MSHKSEFSLADAYPYDRRSTVRWVLSHLWRYRWSLGLALLLTVGSITFYSSASVVIGRAAEEMIKPDGQLAPLALAVMGVLLLDGVCNLSAYLFFESIAKRFAADARQELYASLLGKSQTFHNRQRVGDLMARATDDVSQLSDMIVPGASLIVETVLAILIPITFIGTLQAELLLVPLAYVLVYILAVRAYTRELQPVTARQREQFGQMNAALEETISGIEVVKASAREALEREKFGGNARRLRDTFVQQGLIEARYLPLLLFALTVGLTFLHGLWLFQQGRASIATLIGVMGLVNVLRFPTFISIFTFSLVQSGLASAARILTIIRAETDLDENARGHSASLRGEIEFEHVSFGYEGRPLLRDVTFHIRPGQTVAIVGQTGSGKSSLTALVNRTFEATAGRVRIDGVDVRAWSLDALRSQIGKIEQDIFRQRGPVDRDADPGRPGYGDGRPHQHRHRAPAVHRQERRPHHRAVPGPDHRRGHARLAAGAGRPLRRAVQHVLPAPGD